MVTDLLTQIGLATFVWYATAGVCFALAVFGFLITHIEQLHAVAYALDEDLPDMTERRMLLIVTWISFLLWPVMLVQLLNRDGPWRG